MTENAPYLEGPWRLLRDRLVQVQLINGSKMESLVIRGFAEQFTFFADINNEIVVVPITAMLFVRSQPIAALPRLPSVLAALETEIGKSAAKT